MYVARRNNSSRCVFFSFRFHFFDLHKNWEEEKKKRKKEQCCVIVGVSYFVVMSITLYYLWDGNTFQIGNPSNMFFPFCFCLWLLLLSSAHFSVLFVLFICFLHFPFSLSPLSIIFGSKWNRCVWNCNFSFLPYLCDCDFFSSLQKAES